MASSYAIFKPSINQSTDIQSSARPVPSSFQALWSTSGAKKTEKKKKGSRATSAAASSASARSPPAPRDAPAGKGLKNLSKKILTGCHFFQFMFSRSTFTVLHWYIPLDSFLDSKNHRGSSTFTIELVGRSISLESGAWAHAFLENRKCLGFSCVSVGCSIRM